MADAMSVILFQVLMSRPFGCLSASHRASVIDAITLTVVSPGRVPRAHRQLLRQRLLELPWAWEPSAATVDGLVDRSASQLTHLEDCSLLASFGRGVARRVRDPLLRENIVRLMVLLYVADGGEASDLEAFRPLCHSMGISPTQATEMLDELTAVFLDKTY